METKESTPKGTPLTVRLPAVVVERLDAERGDRSRRHVVEGLIRAFCDGRIDVPAARPQAVVVGTEENNGRE